MRKTGKFVETWSGSEENGVDFLAELVTEKRIHIRHNHKKLATPLWNVSTL